MISGGLYSQKNWGNRFLVLKCCLPSLSVCNTHIKSAKIINQLEKAGWKLRGVKGPHPKKDLGVVLVNKLLKQAGLKLK